MLEPTTRNVKVAALVVTYFPDAEFPERLARVLEQVGRLVIVDNGSDAAALGWAEKLAGTEGVTVERNGANLGIAAALNKGITLLAAESYDWVVTLDQDSAIESGFVAALVATVAGDADPESVALVGGNRVPRRPPGRRTPMGEAEAEPALLRARARQPVSGPTA